MLAPGSQLPCPGQERAAGLHSLRCCRLCFPAGKSCRIHSACAETAAAVSTGGLAEPGCAEGVPVAAVPHWDEHRLRSGIPPGGPASLHSSPSEWNPCDKSTSGLSPDIDFWFSCVSLPNQRAFFPPWRLFLFSPSLKS